MFKIAVLSLGLTAFTIPAFAQSTPFPTTSSDLPSQATSTPVMDGAYSKLDTDHAIGDINAPVTMILYASVTCPHCASWFKSEWPNLKRDYVDTGKLQLVFREFPTAPLQLAIAGFQIANCAPEKDFMDIIDYQMIHQDEIIAQAQAGEGEATYLKIANMAGLKTKEEMYTCINDPKGRKNFQKTGALANAAGIHSVPHAIIGGEKYEGNIGYLQLSRYIDSMMEQSFTPMPNAQTKPKPK